MFLRRKAHSCRRKKEAQVACFRAQGAYVVQTKTGEVDHKNIGWIARKIAMNLI